MRLRCATTWRDHVVSPKNRYTDPLVSGVTSQERCGGQEERESLKNRFRGKNLGVRPIFDFCNKYRHENGHAEAVRSISVRGRQEETEHALPQVAMSRVF